jgi:hypothetical protein
MAPAVMYFSVDYYDLLSSRTTETKANSMHRLGSNCSVVAIEKCCYSQPSRNSGATIPSKVETSKAG